MIYTGGTIGMREDPVTHALVPFDFDHLIDNIPKIGNLGYELGNVQFEQPIDSSNMNPRHWAKIVKAVADNYDRYDGFVVLHGTDTMAYTASALSFMLESLDKPVVVTRSQLPIGNIREDGTENLITALMIAAAKEEKTNKPIVQEVVISFENYLIRGNRATKKSSTNFNAFKSYNYPLLGTMDMHLVFNKDYLLRPTVDRPLTPHYAMDSSVAVLWLFPGISEIAVRTQLMMPGIKAVVLRTFGSGNAPTEKWFLDVISDAVKKGIIIINVTQCSNGGEEHNLYYTGDMLAKTGVISGRDITCEAALTKLMYLLGLGLDNDHIIECLGKNIVGEVTVS